MFPFSTLSAVKRLLRRALPRGGPKKPATRQARLRAEALENRCVPAVLSSFLTTEHVDINLGYTAGSPGTWSLQNSDDDNAVLYDTEDALLYVGGPALTTRSNSSSFDFIGVASGEEFYRLPQSQNPDLLYLGFSGYDALTSDFDRYNPSSESKGRVSGVGRWLKVSLVDVDHFTPSGAAGGGIFSVWQSGTFGTPTVLMSSFNDGVSNPNGNGLDVTDGISADDAVWVLANGHSHYNWGFTEVGRYEVTFKLSGYLNDGNTTVLGQYVESDPIKVYFSVGSVGQVEFDASSYTVDEAAGTASVTVHRVNGSDGQITVDYSTADGTASDGSDYTATSGTLTFADGETSKMITIPITADGDPESDETIQLLLSNPGPSSIADYVVNVEGGNLLGTGATATLTILDDDSLGLFASAFAAPITAANDDAYTVSSGNVVRGNVLFNDTATSPVTASLASAPTKGSVSLNADGSFTYAPGTAFDGSDSFTYALSDGSIATVTIADAGFQEFEVILSTEHVDVGIAYEDGAWDLHVHDEDNDAEYEPGAALLHVGAAALLVRPEGGELDFIGVGAGETFYLLPQSQNPELLYLGVAAEEVEPGTFADGRVRLSLKAVNGPGEFSLWRATDDGPEVLMATSDGITAEDFVLVLEGGHEDLNWGFTAQGRYEVTFEAVATLPDGTVISSGDVTYYFSVDSLGQIEFDAAEVSVGEGGTQTITVRRVSGSDGPLAVQYEGLPLTAGTEDFDPISGELLFADGETVKTFTVTTRTDGIAEGNEMVSLTLTASEDSLTQLGAQSEATLTIIDDDALRVAEVTVNGGERQRSNVETLTVRFNGLTNLDSLIASGQIVQAITLFSGGQKVALSADRFQYDAATFTLVIDVTRDGFGGSRSTLLGEGNYELRLDTNHIQSPTGLADLTDGDGQADGVHRFRFHRLEGDFDGDRRVSLRDLALFLNRFGAVEGSDNRYHFAFDLTGLVSNDPDGRIGVSDLARLLTRLGRRV